MVVGIPLGWVLGSYVCCSGRGQKVAGRPAPAATEAKWGLVDRSRLPGIMSPGEPAKERQRRQSGQARWRAGRGGQGRVTALSRRGNTQCELELRYLLRAGCVPRNRWGAELDRIGRGRRATTSTRIGSTFKFPTTPTTTQRPTTDDCSPRARPHRSAHYWIRRRRSSRHRRDGEICCPYPRDSQPRTGGTRTRTRTRTERHSPQPRPLN